MAQRVSASGDPQAGRADPLSATRGVIEGDEGRHVEVGCDREMEQEVDQEIRTGGADEVGGPHDRDRRREEGGLEKFVTPGDPGCPVEITGREIGCHALEGVLLFDVDRTGGVGVDDDQHVGDAGEMHLPNAVIEEGLINRDREVGDHGVGASRGRPAQCRDKPC
jgi:hypothetical protein